MIEKIMKAVKRGNKKRSRNITIGAVIGFLLSCTAVIGEDNYYLCIKEDDGIKFSIDNSKFSTDNPYNENVWNKETNTYVNNGILSGNKNEGTQLSIGSTTYDISYGIKLELTSYALNLINSGVISGMNILDGNYKAIFGIYVSGDNPGNITNNGTISGEAVNESKSAFITIVSGIYITGKNPGNITNKGAIFTDAEGNFNGSDSYSYGIYIEGDNEKEIINDGIVIMPTNYKMNVYTIRINNSNKGEIINNGLLLRKIDSSAADSSSFRGIIIWGKNEGIVKNNGMILSEGIAGGNTSQVGIWLRGDNTGTAINNGMILGENDRTAEGIYVSINKGEVINNGTISSTAALSHTQYKAGYGIYLDKGQGSTGSVTNTGVIYGNDSAIYIETADSSGTINNYGVLVSDNKNVINEKGNDISGNNYGIKYKTVGGSSAVIAGDSTSVEILVEHEVKRTMDIKNLEDGGFKNTYTNTILNSLKDTYRVEGDTNSVTGSIINAYETAIVYDAENGGNLTLSGTVVNGGAKKDTDTISGSDNGDTLILQAGDILYNNGVGIKSKNTIINGNINMKDGADTIVAGDGTIINGNIDMGDGEDTLRIGNGVIINGTLDGGTGEDTLDFGISSKAKADSDDNQGINIMHNISDFENINVNTNVTVFEKTIDANGKETDLKVSGVKKVTIGETGVLNLRLKNTGDKETIAGEEISKATHAFSGNTGMIIQGEGNGVDIAGTLRFITNGIGKKIYVDMKEIELRNLYFETSSIIDDINGYDVKDKEYIILGAYENLDKIYKPENTRKSSHRYESLNNIYKGIYSSKEDNLDALRVLISSNEKLGNNYDENLSDEEQLKNLLSYLGSIYTETPYSYSSELSRRSAGMFRDITTENQFRPDLNRWLVMGGLTHRDGGTKDSYYGQNYHGFDTGTADVDVDMKLTGAYALGKYGYSENVSLGVTAGGNRSEAKLPMSKVKGNSGYIGAFAENYRGN
ncbi:autotransporter outer membrane beta-barrel domain-containing protein, partial [Fusobacterium varium]